jgi:uroporphyrinogen decarboxylase
MNEQRNPTGMTSHERFQKAFEHKEGDRTPIIDDPWAATVERWKQEGMPADSDYVDYFGLDHVAHISVDNSPQFEQKIIEDTPDHTIYTSSWGVTMKQWKHAASTPEFLAHTIVDRESWEAAKERIQVSPDRIDWKALEINYPVWKENGYWIRAGLWFGFDVTHSWMVGTERVLVALLEDPDWMRDMYETELETDLALYEMVWDAGYHFDSFFWCDDLGYKQNQFFSLRTYRNLLKPFHQRAIDWAHARGVKAHLHSCGDIRPFIPEWIGMGLDALNPLEVKAGVDAVLLKNEYGKDLVLHGGINAVLWDQPEEIRREMEQTVPILKKDGGYIFSSDHSVPSSVGLEDFRKIIELAKKLGSYHSS